ncbi:Sodium channel protein 60E (Drosophila ion channel 60) (Drosophila sodium channel 1) (Protein smell-impaired 60E) (Sodium channel 2) (DmNav2) [Durusdinium trenchii]|uniref:Sodium channel protein 60E (Drosophila ion channel 60) (Drosophila sodium channel 1) (Protein smell-impaired 60E) (Sodium channel 2) (DmNav2) n=1 Tax=Durusdinium trenchii TaxID=1381693 RepID=A0ABP0HK68_9DINO
MAPSADGRFTQLLKELEEVHEEEVSRLRAELREVEDKMMPSPRISPPVLANEGDADQQEVKEAKDQAAETLLIPVEVRHVDSSRSVESQERGSEEKDKLKLKPPTLNLYRGSSNASFVSSLVSPPIPEEEEDDLEHPAIALPSRIDNLFVGPHFEMVVAILLFVNLILMASQLQYHGFITGYEIGYPRYDTSPKDSWPYAESFFIWGDITFAVIFTLEMMVRLLKIRWAFFNAFLNWIDFLVVCSSWAELFAAALPISPTFLRMLRLGKLLRALRVVRMSAVLESLQLLVKCIFASLRILFWSLVLLMVIQCSAGMTISYMLSDYMVNPEGDAAAQFEVFRTFGGGNISRTC